MTYATTEKNKVLAARARWKAENPEMIEMMEGRAPIAPGLALLDGWIVTYYVAELGRALRAANRTLKFVPFRNGASSNHMYAYSDAHDYMLGEIGYDDYRIRGEGQNKFMIASRKINHDKISHGHDQKHMALSISLKQAVKNGCKFLVPHTLEEIALLSFTPFSQALQGVRSEAINTARTFVDKCNNWRVIDSELRHLIRSGAQFITPEFQAAAAEFLRADSEAVEMKQRKVCGQYLQFKEVMGVMRVNILTFDTDWSSDYTMGSAGSTQMLATELSEEMQGKIAMLSMVDKKVHVPEIGMKVNDTTFWLERVVKSA